MKITRFICLLAALLLALSALGCEPGTADATTADSESGTTIDTETSSNTDTTAGGLTEKDTTAAPTAPVSSDTTGAPTAERAAAPVVTSSVNLSKGEVLVFGKCEDGAELTVNGQYTTDLRITADTTNFIFSVTVPKNKSDTLKITASATGKTASAETEFKVSYDKSAEDRGLYVTLTSRIIEQKILTNFYHDELFTEKEQTAIKNCAISRLKNCRDITGKDTKLIYLIVPDALTVYPEQMSEAEQAKVQTDDSRLKQAVAALNSVDGCTAIDLTETLVSHKADGKLYYATDSHWTELGGYYGYAALINEISRDFPAAAPHPLSDYTIKSLEISDTDMIVYAGLDSDVMFEDAPFLYSNYTPITKYDRHKEKTARIWSFVNQYFNGEYSTTRINDDRLPRGIVLFDSYGINCIALISEHFSYLTTEPMWHYTLDYDYVQKVQPDYIITIISERTVSELPSSN